MRRRPICATAALISALKLGQIDYLAIYRSDALQQHLVELPAQINLSDPADAAYYRQGIAQTHNGDLSGKPIVYAATIINGSKKAAVTENTWPCCSRRKDRR